MFCAENIELCGRMMTKSSDSEVDTDYNSQSQAILVACTSQGKGRSIVFTWRDLGRSCGTTALQLVRCAATGADQCVANAIVL